MSTSSGFHTHSSWGRTRRPKNVNGASSTDFITSTTEYFTENQRFLHLVCDGTANVTKVEVYYHGTGIWSELVEASDETTITVAAGKTRIIEIDGVDKIKITTANDGTAGNRVYALLSTF
jgi:hypothetical protein